MSSHLPSLFDDAYDYVNVTKYRSYNHRETEDCNRYAVNLKQKINISNNSVNYLKLTVAVDSTESL